MVPRHHGGSTRTTTAVGRARCACCGRARGVRFYLLGSDSRFLSSAAHLTPLLPPPFLLSPTPVARRASELPFEFADFMGHLRCLMKEFYEAGFCFKECTGLVDNFHITTRHHRTCDSRGVAVRMLCRDRFWLCQLQKRHYDMNEHRDLSIEIKDRGVIINQLIKEYIFLSQTKKKYRKRKRNLVNHKVKKREMVLEQIYLDIRFYQQYSTRSIISAQSLITLIPRDRGFSRVYRAVIAFLLIIPRRFN